MTSGIFNENECLDKIVLHRQLKGMRGFVLLWAGQFVSIFATRMTNFAITLWAWDMTGTATGLVLVGCDRVFTRCFVESDCRDIDGSLESQIGVGSL